MAVNCTFTIAPAIQLVTLVFNRYGFTNENKTLRDVELNVTLFTGPLPVKHLILIGEAHATAARGFFVANMRTAPTRTTPPIIR